MRSLALVCWTQLFVTSALAAPAVNEPGWTVTPFGVVPVSTYAADSPDVDGGGNLYVCAAPDGVYRFSPSGAITLWSAAPGIGLASLSSGEAYLPSRSLFGRSNIWYIQSNGSYSALVDTVGFDWTWAALSPAGTLYVNIWAGPGQGIYEVDRATGHFTSIFAGGITPVANYWDMTTTNDGTLYVSSSSGSTHGVYRFDGAAFLPIATVPTALIGICRGPGDTILGAGFDATGGQVWKIDTVTHDATLFAAGFGQSTGVAYDPLFNRIYVTEQEAPQQVWVIAHEATATQPVTWGELKGKYRDVVR